MEMEVALGEKEKRFLICGDDVLFCTYMMDTYNDNYKAMARDKRNYYQLTPKQIRNKIRSFKRSKTQYQAYLDSKQSDKTQVEATEMETWFTRLLIYETVGKFYLYRTLLHFMLDSPQIFWAEKATAWNHLWLDQE